MQSLCSCITQNFYSIKELCSRTPLTEITSPQHENLDYLLEADVAECKLVWQLAYLQPEVSLEDSSQALLGHDLVFGLHQ